jgi:hypothetical protein
LVWYKIFYQVMKHWCSNRSWNWLNNSTMTLVVNWIFIQITFRMKVERDTLRTFEKRPDNWHAKGWPYFRLDCWFYYSSCSHPCIHDFKSDHLARFETWSRCVSLATVTGITTP